MATQAYIIEVETAICDLTRKVRDAQRVYDAEVKTNDGADNTRHYKANTDVWATLAVNARDLASQLDRLAGAIVSDRRIASNLATMARYNDPR